MPKLVKGLVVYIYRNNPPTRSNMIKADEALVVGPGIPEIFEAHDRPVLELQPNSYNTAVLRPYGHTGYVMFGNSYAMTSDSRFVEAIRKLINTPNFYGAIPVHDWTEDPNFMKA